jgi:hypothetical protein
MTYAKAGPPFNFLGHQTETQRDTFFGWLDARKNNFVPIKEWYQIRAHQLRKSAGILEEYYHSHSDQPLQPSFVKDSWEPGPDGHFAYMNRDDQLPTALMIDIKTQVIPQLQRDDEGQFWMNWLRTLIEKHEDWAQRNSEAPAKLTDWRSQLTNMFSAPEYQAVLVRDKTDRYKDESRFRVHPLDPPTQWEKEQFSHNSDLAVNLKMPDGDLGR